MQKQFRFTVIAILILILHGCSTYDPNWELRVLRTMDSQQEQLERFCEDRRITIVERVEDQIAHGNRKKEGFLRSLQMLDADAKALNSLLDTIRDAFVKAGILAGKVSTSPVRKVLENRDREVQAVVEGIGEFLESSFKFVVSVDSTHFREEYLAIFDLARRIRNADDFRSEFRDQSVRQALVTLHTIRAAILSQRIDNLRFCDDLTVDFVCFFGDSVTPPKVAAQWRE